MFTTKRLLVVSTAMALAITTLLSAADVPTPGYNQKIPEKIMTPEKVETRLGTLNFVDGVPTAETTQIV